MKVLMPQLGETVNEGTISAWHKSEGDEVVKDEMLLDVETDKVATEIPAPVSGVLTRIAVPEGETVEVGTVLAIIGDDDDDDDEEAEPDQAPAVAATEASVGQESQQAVERNTGVQLSPVVRRLAAEHDVDLVQIVGTGKDGRVTRQDVLASLEQPAGIRPPMEGDERIPFDRVRRATAEHMVRSRATSPHVLQAIEVDFSGVQAFRAERGAAWKAAHGYSLSFQAFVARAICLALAEFPRLNASVDGDALVLHSSINLAIAVDLNHEGLLAPVIGGAGDMNTEELAQAIRDLVSRAKSGDLGPDDFANGTYTLSNPGPFGTLFTAPIINQPQVGIMSMDAIQKRAVVVEGPDGDSIEARPVGVLAHSFDHRAVDGAYSAAFLNRLKSLIEQTDWSEEITS